MAVRITWRVDDFKRAIQPAIDAGLYAAATAFAKGASELLNGPSPSSPGSPPGKDMGHLGRSITSVSPQKLGTPGRAAFGTSVHYGRHLEFGAIIRAKRTKYLAIPVDRALGQKLGRLKGSTPHLWSGSGSTIRAIPGLKYIPPIKGKRGGNYGGRLVLASSVKVFRRGLGKRGKNVTASAETTAFVLKKTVTVQPRPWIKRTTVIYRYDAEMAFQKAASARMKAAGVVK